MLSETQVSTRVVLLLFQIIWMSMISHLFKYPADDVTAAWQTTHFNFHDIDENVLKLDILGHDDPTMIRKLQDLSGIDPKIFEQMIQM